MRRPRARIVLPLGLVFASLATVARAEEDPGAPIPVSDTRVLHALSLYGRGLFVPDFLLGIGLQQGNSLSSGGLGLSYIYRKGSLDIVTSLDLSFLSPSDGNYLGVGKDPMIDTHYVHFDNLNFLSLDVGFFWVQDMNKWVAFTIGGGVGLGLLLGDVWVVNNSGAGCATGTLGDPSQCHPNVDPVKYTSAPNNDPVPTWMDANGKVQTDFTAGVCATNKSICLTPSDPDFQRKLDGLHASQADCLAKKGNDCRDTAGHPFYHTAPEKPPVMVVINFQLGFKFKIRRHFNINLTGGFRNGFVVGGGPEYVF